MKNPYKNVSTALLFSLMVILFSCNKDINTSDTIISTPFQSVRNEYQTFEVKVSKGKVISMANGSKIIIPANAFINKENQPVNGNVKILYREFHDASDIIISGIPMQYDSAGVKSPFQTAGMFEIKGFHNNEPVYIANDKSIEIKLASDVGENIYNFYALDTSAGSWQYVGNSSPEINAEKQKKIEVAVGKPAIAPIAPQRFDPNQFVFDMKINTKKYPELTDFHDIIWQYAGNSDSIDPEKNAWIFQEKWTNVSLKISNSEQSIFWLSLKNKSKSFTTLVKAVFSDKKIEAAKKNYQERKEQYDAYLTRLKTEARRYQNEKNFIRNFQVRNMGIFNWDKIFPGLQVLAADFEFDQEVNTNLLTVFVVTGDSRVAMPYKKGEWKNFRYAPGQNNMIVAIMPGDKIAISKELMDLQFGLGQSPQKHTFKLTTLNKQIKQPNDLREILNNL